MMFDKSKLIIKNENLSRKLFKRKGGFIYPIFKCPLPPEDPNPVPTSFGELDIAIQNRAIALGYKSLSDLANVVNIADFLGSNCTVERLDLRVFTNVTVVRADLLIGLNNLKSLNLGNITLIGTGKTNNFPALTEIYGENLETIDTSGPSPLRGEYTLETISLPNLKNCTGYFALANIFTKTKSISLPNYVGYTDYMFAHGNVSEEGNLFLLEKVYLPKVKFAGVLMFKNCTKLSTIYMPEVETLAGGTFFNCTSLKEIHLETVTKIVKNGDSPTSNASDGNNPFAQCNYANLKVYLGEVPPTVESSIKPDGASELTIVVPSETAKAAYQADSWWGRYTNIVVAS